MSIDRNNGGELRDVEEHAVAYALRVLWRAGYDITETARVLPPAEGETLEDAFDAGVIAGLKIASAAALESPADTPEAPLLGLATTAELLAEVQARVEVDGSANYRTYAPPADTPEASE